LILTEKRFYLNFFIFSVLFLLSYLRLSNVGFNYFDFGVYLKVFENFTIYSNISHFSILNIFFQLLSKIFSYQIDFILLLISHICVFSPIFIFRNYKVDIFIYSTFFFWTYWQIGFNLDLVQIPFWCLFLKFNKEIANLSKFIFIIFVILLLMLKETNIFFSCGLIYYIFSTNFKVNRFSLFILFVLISLLVVIISPKIIYFFMNLSYENLNPISWMIKLLTIIFIILAIFPYYTFKSNIKKILIIISPFFFFILISYDQNHFKYLNHYLVILFCAQCYLISKDKNIINPKKKYLIPVNFFIISPSVFSILFFGFYNDGWSYEKYFDKNKINFLIYARSNIKNYKTLYFDNDLYSYDFNKMFDNTFIFDESSKPKKNSYIISNTKINSNFYGDKRCIDICYKNKLEKLSNFQLLFKINDLKLYLVK